MKSSHLPVDALGLFEDVGAQWWIAGGWGIDLWLGEQTRDHVDLDVAILRRDQRVFRDTLSGWELHVATAPGVLSPWVDPIVPEPLHAIWCRPTPQSEWAFELLLNDALDDAWLFRRDHDVRLPLVALGGRTSDDIPYLSPEVILLYKAKSLREHDVRDFRIALPKLDPAARSWLRSAIERVHPGHEWLVELA